MHKKHINIIQTRVYSLPSPLAIHVASGACLNPNHKIATQPLPQAPDWSNWLISVIHAEQCRMWAAYDLYAPNQRPQTNLPYRYGPLISLHYYFFTYF